MAPAKKGGKKRSPWVYAGVGVGGLAVLYLYKRYQANKSAVAANTSAGLVGGTSIPAATSAGTSTASPLTTLAEWTQAALAQMTGTGYSPSQALNDITAWVNGSCVSQAGYSAIGNFVQTAGLPPGFGNSGAPTLSVCASTGGGTGGGGTGGGGSPAAVGNPFGLSAGQGNGSPITYQGQTYQPYVGPSGGTGTPVALGGQGMSGIPVGSIAGYIDQGTQQLISLATAPGTSQTIDAATGQAVGPPQLDSSIAGYLGAPTAVAQKGVYSPGQVPVYDYATGKWMAQQELANSTGGFG